MKKVCVVTGGGSGIGFAAAKEAAKKGYYVMIVGRNEKKLAGAVEELRKDGCEAEAYSCDVSDRENCFIRKKSLIPVSSIPTYPEPTGRQSIPVKTADLPVK